MRHIPRDDVAYRPGVDVYGHPVAPADLHDYSAITESLPETIEFPIVLSAARINAALADKGLGETSLTVGKITYNIRTDRLEFNGIPLTDPEQQRLAEECAKLGVVE